MTHRTHKSLRARTTRNHEDPDPDPDGRWALQAKKGTEGEEEKAAHPEPASDSRGL